MLVVDKPYRKLKLGSELVSRALAVMQAEGADECVLEARRSNFFFCRPNRSLTRSVNSRAPSTEHTFSIISRLDRRDMRVLFIGR